MRDTDVDENAPCTNPNAIKPMFEIFADAFKPLPNRVGFMPTNPATLITMGEPL